MNIRQRIPVSHDARALLAVALLLALAVLGCAYYNTLYNAKARFRDAEGTQPRDRDGAVTRQTIQNYDDVIAKCRKMIATWPDSRHADDAMLLMARSYRRSDRFEECVGVLDSLEARFPNTELLESVWAEKGGALSVWGQHEQAVEVLEKCAARYKPRTGVLYDLTTSLMSLDRSEKAIEYLGVLETRFPKEERTLEARIAMAEILAEKEQYEQSREVYARLGEQRLPETVRHRVWTGHAEVELALGRNVEALVILGEVRKLDLTPEQSPPVLLMTARAYEGADSTGAAIATYERIASRYSRGEYGAEAQYHLGMIYEKMDSLTIARQHFEEVPKAYANSPFARESIKRGNDIAKLQKLEESADGDSPDAQALRQLALAELQLFQLDNPAKALEAYQKLLADFPDAEYAPKAAFAVGYIYGVLLADSARAMESYRFLVERYPQSQQAANAGQFLATLGVAPPVPGPGPWTGTVPAATPVPDSTGAPADTSRAIPAGKDE
jgi:TolA-binding protein